MSEWPRVTLILGGARSGKSRRALQLAEGARRKVYVATAEALDAEMADRIAQHRSERGTDWETIEAPRDLAAVLQTPVHADALLVVDCLTLWLSNLLCADADLAAEQERLIVAIRSSKAQLVIVSNEVGLGLVPETPLGRAFRDAQGRLNQAVAAAADRVEFVAAGLPLVLKG